MHAEKMQLEGYQYQEWPAQHEPVPLPPVDPEDPTGADPEWEQEEEDEQEHEEEEAEEARRSGASVAVCVMSSPSILR